MDRVKRVNSMLKKVEFDVDPQAGPILDTRPIDRGTVTEQSSAPKLKRTAGIPPLEKKSTSSLQQATDKVLFSRGSVRPSGKYQVTYMV